MNIRHIISAALLLCAAMPAAASAMPAPQSAMTSPEMTGIFRGEGYGETYEEACSNALADLLRHIVVTVEGSTRQTANERIGPDGQLQSEIGFSSVANSFSSATTLHNVEYYAVEETPEFHVKCLVRKDEVEKMYERRKDKVLDLVYSARRAEERGAVNNALRYLYQAYVLLHSLQYPDEMKGRIDGTDRLLVNWIPEKMNEICSDVRFAIVSGEGDTYNLLVTYKGEPAAGVDFTYWDGKKHSPVIGAKDGMAQISFPEGMKPTDVNVSIEYEYADEVHSDPQVAPLLKAFSGHSTVRENAKRISFTGNTDMATKAEKKVFEQAMTAGQADGVTEMPKGEAKAYASAMEKLLKCIAGKNYASAAPLFTEDGLEMFRKLLQYGNARLLVKPDRMDYRFYPMKERVVCRSIPMSFEFEKGKRKFIEDVTFTFNNDGLIESLAFSLGSEATNSVFAQGGDRWSEYTKMVIVSFLENYKTAFALKRADYIESIFDDNAYIIVGHVVKRLEGKRGPDGMMMRESEEVKYQRKTKDEYINGVKRCFASNEFVNIRFADSDVAKAGFGGETFGIQIKQDYSSSSYGDHGYLFLMVDFNDEDSPLITIRTWQPERVKDITPNLPKTSRDYGIYGIGSFS